MQVPFISFRNDHHKILTLRYKTVRVEFTFNASAIEHVPESPNSLPFHALFLDNLCSYQSFAPRPRYNSLSAELTFNASPIEHAPESPIALPFHTLFLNNSCSCHFITSYQSLVLLNLHTQIQYCES